MAVLIALVLIFGVFLNIYFYNHIVSLRHMLVSSQKNLQKLEVANADLKNDLYKILDADSLTSLASNFGLIKENKPEYLENSWAVASHY